MNNIQPEFSGGFFSFFFPPHIQDSESYIFCFVRQRVICKRFEAYSHNSCTIYDFFKCCTWFCLWDLHIFVCSYFGLVHPIFENVFVMFCTSRFCSLPYSGTKPGSNWNLCGSLNDYSGIWLKEWRQPQDLHQHRWQLHSPTEVIASPDWRWMRKKCSQLPWTVKTRYKNRLQYHIIMWVGKDLWWLSKPTESRFYYIRSFICFSSQILGISKDGNSSVSLWTSSSSWPPLITFNSVSVH